MLQIVLDLCLALGDEKCMRNFVVGISWKSVLRETISPAVEGKGGLVYVGRSGPVAQFAVVDVVGWIVTNIMPCTAVLRLRQYDLGRIILFENVP